MKKENCKIINLKKGVIREYQIKDIKLLSMMKYLFLSKIRKVFVLNFLAFIITLVN